MELIINFSDSLSKQKIKQLTAKIQTLLTSEVLDLNIETKLKSSNDAWNNLDFDNLVVDTGIEDFALNHDYYLYGMNK
ncbi:hypothetical protein [Geminocystis sp. NIES-3709]|uniref:hypothetical protein n=1 Tax=Geminocystis sp. NIES-3709 TaxID=1617448 RepID=UPI0005FC7345|nr:hypothetical protein [Geminocystis sp. NIES-3709]BAQ64817.1 hypothetical protein GM3709_1582 [Geminocystis sp. NIES-3709]